MVTVLAAILCLTVCVALASTPELDDNLRFERFSLDEGLSHSTVTSILQDSRGYLWMGTGDGLNRYDGNGFKTFRHVYGNPHSLAANFILSLYEDDDGVLWIGTYKGGLNRYDSDTGEFERFIHDPDNPDGIASNDVGPIVPDEQGRLWLGLRQGLDMYDPRTGIFTHFSHNPLDEASLCCNEIYTLLHDGDGMLWIGTNDGLDMFNPTTGVFTHYRDEPGNPDGLGNDSVHTLYETSDGFLWVGTEGGLYALDRRTDTFLRYTHDPSDSNSISDDIVLSLYESGPDMLWIGTSYGLDILDRRTGYISHYHHDPLDSSSIGENWIKVICRDRTGIFWFGTNNGVSKCNPRKSAFSHFYHHPLNANSLSANAINRIAGSRDGTIWIATDTGGLDHFNPATGTFTHYRADSGRKNAIPSDWVTVVYVDSDDYVWAATGEGLVRIDTASGELTTFKHVPEDETTINGNWVLSLFEDSTGSLWIGTGNGLNSMDRHTGVVRRYSHDPADSASLSYPTVRCVAEDERGRLWVATDAGLNRMKDDHYSFERIGGERLGGIRIISLCPDGGVLWLGTVEGLCRYDMDSGGSRWLTERDGLPGNTIVSLEKDDDGFLWIGTNGGLAVLNDKTGSVRTYDADDGLQSNQFSRNASWKSPEGFLYFGGVNGFNRFHPAHIRRNDIVPPVVITSFLKFNEPARLPRDKYISLKHDENFFTIEYAALDYSSPGKNRYAYKLEGLDRDWTDAGNRQIANYSGIPHGEYTFRVRGANSDGVWNKKGAAIRITIEPPFWGTAWFHMLIGISVVILIVGVHLIRVRSIKARQHELERLVARRTEALERKTDELVSERRRLFSLLEALPAFVFLQDNTYAVRFANSRLKEVFPAVSGMPCHKVFHGLDEPCADCPTMKVFHHKEHLTWEWTPTNGRCYQMMEYPFDDIDDTELVLKLAIDITERKQAEIDRLSSEKMQVVLEMAGAASHEFTQPLQVICGHMELLVRNGMESDVQIKERLNIINDQIHRMQRITKKLQKITRYKTKDYFAGKKIIDIDGSVDIERSQQ